MTDRDFGAGRAMEDNYFHKKDRELIEKMRRAAADEKARSEMAAQIRIDDPGLIKDLRTGLHARRRLKSCRSCRSCSSPGPKAVSQRRNGNCSSRWPATAGLPRGELLINCSPTG